MLHYFPTPYPNEWWYSVLCRYYVWSGLMHYRSVLNELYNTRRRVHGRLIPGADCYAVLSGLPEGLLSIEDVLLSHTLLPYYLRFYTKAKKKEVLASLIAGRQSGITNIDCSTPERKEGLKYCPICYEEDRAKYGEPYWHREHQIPLISICPIHRCKLILHEVKFSALSEVFLPLASIKVLSSDEALRAWEPAVTDTAYTYLMLPYLIGSTKGYSNLQNALQNAGAGLDKFQQKTTISVPKVMQMCLETYGKEMTERYFGRLSPAILDRICKWTITSPEKYVLLSVAANLSPRELFEVEIDTKLDEHLEALLELQGTGIYQKQELAKKLGLTPYRLEALAKMHDIEPFWKHSVSELRTEAIRMMLTKEEKEVIIRAARQAGNGQVAVFAREVLLKYCREF